MQLVHFLSPLVNFSEIYLTNNSATANSNSTSTSLTQITNISSSTTGLMFYSSLSTFPLSLVNFTTSHTTQAPTSETITSISKTTTTTASTNTINATTSHTNTNTSTNTLTLATATTSTTTTSTSGWYLVFI